MKVARLLSRDAAKLPAGETMSLCSNPNCRHALPNRASYCPRCGTQVGASGAKFAFGLVIGITLVVLLLGLMVARATNLPAQSTIYQVAPERVVVR